MSKNISKLISFNSSSLKKKFSSSADGSNVPFVVSREERLETLQSPKHLIVLIHGVNGFASDCEYIGREIRKANPSKKVYIAAPTVNQGLSHDGILLGSKRYLRWIKSHIKRNPSITELSIIGHSLGGLYARCLVGLLWKEGILAPRGPIKGHTLITLATPHLPPRQWDHLFGRKLGAWMLQALIGKSGQDLFLLQHGPKSTSKSSKVEENQDATALQSLEERQEQDMPILQQMALSPKYLDPLKTFSRLLTYANVKSDPVINYANASLSHSDLCPKKTELVQGGKDVAKPLVFEHCSLVQELEKNTIGYDEIAKGDVEASATTKFQLKGVTADMPDLDMIKNLSSLPWKRYGILPSRKVLAHADMVIKFKEMSLKHGAPVISHIASHFSPQELDNIEQQEQEYLMGESNTTSSAETTCIDEVTTSTASEKVGDENEEEVHQDKRNSSLQSVFINEPEKRSLLFN